MLLANDMINNSNIHPLNMFLCLKMKSKELTCLSWGILALCLAMAIARENPPIASIKPHEAASLPAHTLPVLLVGKKDGGHSSLPLSFFILIKII